MNEAELQKLIRIQYAQIGCLLWRNNVGACKDDAGNFVRYGLANESRQMNANIKSSDLIGINPVVITPEMVGLTIGQFIALECKRPDWKFKGTDREMAQANFISLVNNKGGIGQFVSNK